MKKGFAFLAVLAMVLLGGSFATQAYTINDPANDRIGDRVFETYGINVYNFTPGVNSGSIVIDLFTNYPQSGVTVNGTPPWFTQAADLFITETYHGAQYQWAVPLVSHDGFLSGNMYAVGTFLTSDDLDPSNGSGYTYNHGVPVQIATIGNNYGFTDMGSAGAPYQAAVWSTLAGSPDYMVHLNLGIFEDDPNGRFSFLWGTATCANDIVSGQVPIPPPVLLLGTGLLGLVGLKKWRRRGQKTAAAS